MFEFIMLICFLAPALLMMVPDRRLMMLYRASKGEKILIICGSDFAADDEFKMHSKIALAVYRTLSAIYKSQNKISFFSRGYVQWISTNIGHDKIRGTRATIIITSAAKLKLPPSVLMTAAHITAEYQRTREDSNEI